MFRTLRARLLFTYLLITGLVLVLVGFSLVVFILRNVPLERRVFQQLEVVASLVGARGGRILEAGDPERLQAALSRLGRQGTRVLVLGSQGEVLVDSRLELPPPPAGLLTKIVVAHSAQQGTYGGPTGARWLYVTEPVGEERTLMLVAPRPRILSEFGDDLFRPLLRAALVGLIASTLLAWLVSRWIASPLQRTAEAARAVASGDYRHKLKPEGPDEVRSVAVAFNEMVQRVQAGQQAMRDFVANVSHELKTPLTSIQGFAQAIIEEAASDPAARRHAAGVIFDESDRLRRLVEDLLDLARFDAGQVRFEREPVDLGAVLRAVIERFGPRAREKGVRLEDQIPPLPTLVGDGDRLAQVFTNLIDNAMEHSPPGGAVEVRGEHQDGWITVHVDDSGPGIPAEELTRVFERFYQLDKSRRRGEGRGSGLGLAISREVVQAHGGRLLAQSTMGKGSRFSVQLPVVRPEDETLVRKRP